MGMNYNQVFEKAIERLHAEGRYRVFIDILRNKGAFPNARCFAGHNGPKPITVWCSNDYLAMGQHPRLPVLLEFLSRQMLSRKSFHTILCWMLISASFKLGIAFLDFSIIR